MRLTFDGNTFIYNGQPDPGQPWHWRSDLKAWCTPNPQVAARFRSCADRHAENKLQSSLIDIAPWTGRIPFPKGLKPKPFQPGAARFALERNHSYLALDPGLGKTIVAALIMNALGRHPVVIVVPPFLALNTKDEFEKWCTWKPRISIYGHGPDSDFFDCDVQIIPDSLVAHPAHSAKIAARVVFKTAMGDATLFVDEAHRFKSDDAKRARAIFFLARHFGRIAFLSGTPMPNGRPMELYPILSRFAPETIGFRSYFQFGMRYCDGYHDGYGYVFTGASNMKEFSANVKGRFMLRLRKKDVLKDLPPKTEELIFLAENLPPQAAKVERALLMKHSPEDLMGHLAPNGHTATYRRMVGLAKTPLAISYLKDLLNESAENILVFAIHTEVIEKLTAGLSKFKPLVIVGATPKKMRHDRVSAFQSGASRVLIGNITACGVGFTLTKATRAVFVESSWVPGENDQAADRMHRIGQRDNVLVQYLVFKNSIDKAVMESNLRKRKNTEQL